MASLTSVEVFSPAADREASGGAVVATRRPADGSPISNQRAGGRGVPRHLSPAGGQLGGLAPAQWQAEAERLIADGCHLQAALMAGPVGGTVKCFVR